MKVALLCPNFPPEFTGGTERVAAALAHALRRLGVEVVVISGSDVPHRGDDVVREEAAGVPVLRLPRRADEGYHIDVVRPRLQRVLAQVLRAERVEVVHLHHWATLTVRAVRTAQQHGIPSVVTVHDMWSSCVRFFRRPPAGITCPPQAGRDACAACVQRDLPDQALAALRGAIAARDAEIKAELGVATAVTAPSASSAAKIAAHVPWPRVEVVPHGLLEPVRRPASFGPARTPFRVGTFGNLVADKGVAVLVEAMAGLAAELHLFGPFLDAEFGRTVRARARELDVALTCHGPFDATAGHPARELDVAVFPSLCEETYGLVVEEALARGVPVVVSDRGALAERIGGGGLVVPAGDPAALQAALRGLIDDATRYAALRGGVPRQFASITTAARRYVELYDRARQVRP